MMTESEMKKIAEVLNTFVTTQEVLMFVSKNLYQQSQFDESPKRAALKLQCAVMLDRVANRCDIAKLAREYGE